MRHSAVAAYPVIIGNCPCTGALQTLDSLLSSAVVSQRVRGESGGLFGLSEEEVREAAGVTRSDITARKSEMRTAVVPIRASPSDFSVLENQESFHREL